jgi:putative membrane protein
MWKQVALAAALVALAGGCEDRNATRTTSNGRVTGSGTDTTNRTTTTYDTNRTTGAGTTSTGTTPTTASTPAQPDTEFLRKASSINTLEIDAAKIALERSQNDDVRAFAEMLGKDHADAKDRLKDIADKQKVDFPKDVLPEHRSIEDRLKGLKGTQFDQEFVKDMVDGHQQAIDLFQQEANSGQNDQLKGYAQSMLPSLQMHLDKAKQLQTKIGSGGTPEQPSTPPSSTPPSGSEPGSNPGSRPGG